MDTEIIVEWDGEQYFVVGTKRDKFEPRWNVYTFEPAWGKGQWVGSLICSNGKIVHVGGEKYNRIMDRLQKLVDVICKT